MKDSAQPFGRYILMDCVAVGGMAEIFLAKTVGADGREQQLAIKRILPSYSEDEGFVTMFKDEANIAQQLDHPNIVRIYEFGEVSNEHFIAMEYIHGADLKRLIEVAEKNSKRFTPTQVAFVIGEVAKALDYAHKRTAADRSPLNIVHRDVTPHNIMLTFTGDVKLMDFGIAKAASRATKTRAGTVKGKCSYMSPEQARGKPLDGRSDMFSLGIIAWEMLTGKRLFTGASDFDILSKVLKSEIPNPRNLDSNVPEELARIILKALERDRERRYVDCGEMLGDLNQFLFHAADAQNNRLALWTMALANHGGHIPGELPNHTSSVEEEEDVSQEKTQMLSITEMEEKLGLLDGETDDGVQDAAKTIPLDGNMVSAFLEQQNLMPGNQNRNQPMGQHGMQPGMMQPGMMQPGMMQQGMMQPGMMQPGMMQPGMMQPGMMQQGMMQQGMMQQGMMPYGYNGQMNPYGAPPPAKGNTGLIIAIVLVLLLIVGGAGGAFYYLKVLAPAATQAVETAEQAAPAADTPISYLTFKTVPAGATVTVNGEKLPNPTPIFGHMANLGDKLVISFELENYERLTIERSVIKQSQVVEEELKAVGKAVAVAPDPKVNPSDPGPTQTGPSDPADPGPTDPGPTDPGPTDPGPTDPVTPPENGGTAAAATGSLKIESVPEGSKVRIDTKSISGVTPLVVNDLPLGVEMEIVISPASKDFSRIVRSKYKLEKEGETLLSVKHKKAEETVVATGTAKISVSATPWGQVYLDGQRLGNTPIKDREVSAGKHKLEIAFPPKSKRVDKSIRLKNGDSVSYGYDFNSDSWK